MPLSTTNPVLSSIRWHSNLKFKSVHIKFAELESRLRAERNIGDVGLNTVEGAWTMSPIGGLISEPPLESVELLISIDAITDGLGITLDDDPLLSSFL